MKKGVALLLSIFLLGIILVSGLAVADNHDNSSDTQDSEEDSNREDSESMEIESEIEVEIESGSDDENDSEEDSIEIEAEEEIEIGNSGARIRYKEKYEAEYSNGTKIKYEYEIRERRILNEQEKMRIIKERNRLRIHEGLNQSECPTNCSCSPQENVIKCKFNGSREMTIRAGNSGNVIVQIKNVNASTNVTLYKSEDGKVYGNFRNNETRRIILPDEAKERIELKLKERVRLHNENITLDENGTYRIEAEKRARLLLLFKIREEYRAEIDAETGEILKERKPWWGFLARDIREEMMNETGSSE